MNPDRWRMQVEVRLAALERQLDGLHGRERAVDANGGQKGVLDDGKESQSESEWSENGAGRAASLFCECAPTGDAPGGPHLPGSLSGMREVTAEDIEDMDNYALKESVWDVAVLVGLDSVSVGCSFIMLLLILFNFMIQLSFCLILMENMLSDGYSEEKLSHLLKFRTSTAHSIRQADMTAGRSLASQICSQDDTLPWAGAQFNLYGQITAYLGHFGYAGKRLCFMSIFLWMLKVGTEIHEVWQFGIAILQLPRRSRSILARPIGGAETPAKFLCMTQLRLFSTLGVLAARLVIGTLLLYIGIKYLVITASLSDLILNSMALAFVIDIDEMLYAAFVPRHVRNLQASVEALPIRTPRISRRLPSLTTWVRCFFTCLLLFFVWIQWLTPFHNRVVMAGEIMCAGNLDFVYAVNQASSIVSATPTFGNGSGHGLLERASVVKLAFPALFYGPEPRFTWHFTSRKLSDPDIAVREEALGRGPVHGMGRTSLVLPPAYGWTHVDDMANMLDAMITTQMTAKILADTEEINALSQGTAPLAPSGENLEAVFQLDIGGVAGGVESAVCLNILPAQMPAAFSSVLQRLFPGAHTATNFSSLDDLAERGDERVDVCRQFVEMCQFRNMTSLRSLCPVACGCHIDMFAPAGFYGNQQWGCPRQCEFLRQAVAKWSKQHHNSAPCIDSLPEDFASKETRLIPPPKSHLQETLIENYLAVYINGAFEHLQTQPDFTWNAKLIIHNPVIWGPMNLSMDELDRTVEFMTSLAFVRATQAGRWEFLPGKPHPRGKRGCEFWTSWEMIAIWGINFCEIGTYRTLRFPCPRTCGCSSRMRECPLTCP